MTAENLRALREDAGVSQNALAWELGVSEKSIRRFEAGTHGMPKSLTLEDYVTAVRRIHERQNEAQR